MRISTLIFILVATFAGGLLLLFFFPAGIRPVFAASAVVVLIPMQAALADSLAVDSAEWPADRPTSLGLRRWMAGFVELRPPLRLDESYPIVTGAVVAWFVVASVAVSGFQFGWEHFNHTGAVVWGLILGTVWWVTLVYLLVRIASGLHSCFARKSAGSGLRDVFERMAMVAFLLAPAMSVGYCVYETKHIKRGLSASAAHYYLPPQAIEQTKDIGKVP